MEINRYQIKCLQAFLWMTHILSQHQNSGTLFTLVTSIYYPAIYKQQTDSTPLRRDLINRFLLYLFGKSSLIKLFSVWWKICISVFMWLLPWYFNPLLAKIAPWSHFCLWWTITFWTLRTWPIDIPYIAHLWWSTDKMELMSQTISPQRASKYWIEIFSPPMKICPTKAI